MKVKIACEFKAGTDVLDFVKEFELDFIPPKGHIFRIGRPLGFEIVLSVESCVTFIGEEDLEQANGEITTYVYLSKLEVDTQNFEVDDLIDYMIRNGWR